jgi:hypothetical protein
MNRSPETSTYIIKIYEQGGGLNFEGIEPIPNEGGEPVEYKATIFVALVYGEDVKRRLHLAMNLENGVFLQYPSFRDGLNRRIQVAHLEVIKTNNGNVGRLTVILQQADYEDFMGKSSTTTGI